MVEEWKDIKGYEGIYKISNLGKIVRIKGRHEHPMKVWNNGRYMEVVLSKEGKTTHFTLHRLLATHFIPNPNNFPSVNHKDENKLNNSINNLEWCTYAYNTNYGEGIRKRVQSRLLSGAGRHPILVSDELSGSETIYPTIRECIKALHMTSRTVYKYIGTGISYKGKSLIIMNKTLTVRQFAAVKRVAQNVNPLVVKKNKIAAKISELNKEYNDLIEEIEGYEVGVKKLTGGLNSESLVVKKVEDTGKVDKDGKPIKVTKYEPKEGVITFNAEANVYELCVEEDDFEPVAAGEIDDTEVASETEVKAGEEALFDPMHFSE